MKCDRNHKNTAKEKKSFPPLAAKIIKSFCGCYTGQGGQFSRKEPPLIGSPRRGPAGGKYE